jgi:aminopeptidase N
VHQLTHAALPSPRPWIYEGLAHFAQALYVEKRNGREAALEFMNASRQQIVDREKAIVEEHEANAASDQSLINTSSEEFVRSKAMYVWWMLRDMLGDPATKAAIASYKADQDHEPSYVQHLVAAQSKRDLEWFFDDWVYRDRGLPDFRIVSVYPRQTLQNTYLLTITVENLGEAGAEVPVMAPYQGIETTERLQIKGKAQNSVRLQMGTIPDEATVNDGSVPETDFTNDTVKVQVPAK